MTGAGATFALVGLGIFRPTPQSRVSSQLRGSSGAFGRRFFVAASQSCGARMLAVRGTYRRAWERPVFENPEAQEHHLPPMGEDNADWVPWWVHSEGPFPNPRCQRERG